MKIWIVIGKIDYEASAIAAVAATYHEAWTAMLDCVNDWDEVAIEAWNIGDRLTPGAGSFDLTRVRAEARPDYPGTDDPPWHKIAHRDIYVREYTPNTTTRSRTPAEAAGDPTRTRPV